MNIEEPFNLFHIYYHHFLLGIAIVFIVGCSEPLPPVPKTTLATPISSSTTPKPVLSQPADEPKQELQDTVMRKLDSEKVQRGKIVYQTNCANCHGQNGESRPDWRKQGPDGKYPPPPLNGSAHTWHHSTDTLTKTIREGSPPEIGNMPGWGDKLTDEEIDDVIVWITSIWPAEVYDIWYKEIERKNQEKKEHKLD
jgi:mono/diheme cytochrome c family protein